MNLGKALTFAAAIMLAICFVPVASDDSDATENHRLSTMYLYEGVLEKDSDTFIYSSYLCFIEDSPGHKNMKRYLADPTDVSISIDDSADRNEIMTPGWTGTVYVYRTYEYYYGSTYGDYVTKSDYIVLKQVLEPYGSLVFFVKAGDTISLTVTAVDNKGSKVVPYIYTTSGIDYIDPSVEYECLKPTEVVVKFQTTTSVYIDTSYDVSGNSMPNGSAAAYVTICAAITIMVLAVMIVASFKPGWSK